MGNFSNEDLIKSGTLNEGTMGNVAASPNDPVFINHHTMIDSIFEQWLQQYPNSEYDGPDNDLKFAGHSDNDCIVPFIPVYTHMDMFNLAEDFGYSYDYIKSSNTPTTGPTTANTPNTGSTTARTSSTGSTTARTPRTGSTTAKSPSTGSTTAKSPSTGSTTARSPSTGSTTARSPSTGSVGSTTATTDSSKVTGDLTSILLSMRFI